MSDDTVALQATLDASAGRPVRLSPGTYRTTAPLVLPVGTTLIGAGRNATTINADHVGDCFRSIHPINSSTLANLLLSDLSIVTSHVGNVGSGFVDVGGSIIRLERLQITGFGGAAQIILDQSELVVIADCVVTDGGVPCIWLVNGPDHTTLADLGYTNRITIRECQFDSYPVETIVDDGGMCHVIENNNFNDGSMALRAAMVCGLIFKGNECEYHRTANIVLTNTRKNTVSVEPCQSPIIEGNLMMVNIGDNIAHCIDVQACRGGSITNNTFGAYVTSGVRFAVPMNIFGNTRLTWSSSANVYSIDGGVDTTGFLISQPQTNS